MNYESVSSKYKLKFYNFILRQFLDKFGGYNIQHDDMVYKLSNFGAKVRPGFINFTFGTRDEDVYILIDMLTSYGMFDIKQLQSNIVQINFNFTPEKIKWLKYKRSLTQSQKKMKQLILNCYRKIKDIQYDKQQSYPE